jgi:RecA-family ATPase
MAIQPLNIMEIYDKELEKLDFVFKGLKTKTIGFISGAGGTGKSMMALHIAFSLADFSCAYNFDPLIDKNTPRGKVVYLNLEDPIDVLEYRVKRISNKIASNYNIGTLDNINENLFIFPLYGKDFTLYKNGELQEKIYNNLLELGRSARIVIIDTFRRLHDENENDNAIMSQVLKTLENVCNETGTTILLLHHQNKNSILEKNTEQTAMRGASALVDNARLLINMTTITSEEAKKLKIQEERRKQYVKVSFAKVNYSAIPSDFYLVKELNGTLDKCNCEEVKNGKKI